jgi:hypothetical protein
VDELFEGKIATLAEKAKSIADVMLFKMSNANNNLLPNFAQPKSYPCN